MGVWVGVWTWLDRWDPRARQLPGFDDDPWRHRSGPWHAEGIHTGRAWHALHVALTGEEEGGAPPLAYVVWTTPGAAVSFTQASFQHEVDVVQSIAEALGWASLEAAEETLSAALDLGVFVYSFEGYGPDRAQDLVQCGAFRAVFEGVRRFYGAAAAAGQIVTVQRG